MRLDIAERDTLKENCQGIRQFSKEVTSITDITESLEKVITTKENTIAKLKSKLMHTIRGRDRWKENCSLNWIAFGRKRI